VFGPNRGTRVTFTHPKSASSRWRGVPEPDEAAPTVIRSYLAAYGPATPDNFGRWLSQGRILGRTLKTWFATTEGVAPIEVDGETAYVLAEDVDELAAARPSKAVCLVGGFDSWVLGPGTADTHVIPSGRRTAVSKQSGWIAPVVLVGGVVAATWAIERDRVSIDWFAESGKPPTGPIGAEVARWAGIVGRDLSFEVRPT
jgi:hypothetical protein